MSFFFFNGKILISCRTEGIYLGFVFIENICIQSKSQFHVSFIYYFLIILTSNCYKYIHQCIWNLCWSVRYKLKLFVKTTHEKIVNFSIQHSFTRCPGSRKMRLNLFIPSAHGMKFSLWLGPYRIIIILLIHTINYSIQWRFRESIPYKYNGFTVFIITTILSGGFLLEVFLVSF